MSICNAGRVMITHIAQNARFRVVTSGYFLFIGSKEVLTLQVFDTLDSAEFAGAGLISLCDLFLYNLSFILIK